MAAAPASVVKTQTSKSRCDESKGMLRFVKALIAAGRKGSMAATPASFVKTQASKSRCDESKGMLRLVKALITAGRKESTVRIYGMMKRSGHEMDDYLGKVLSKGLRRV